MSSISLPALLVKVSSARKKGFLKVSIVHPNNHKTLWFKEVKGTLPEDFSKVKALADKPLAKLSKTTKTREIKYDFKGRRLD